jgi:hypothetical protein
MTTVDTGFRQYGVTSMMRAPLTSRPCGARDYARRQPVALPASSAVLLGR